MIWYKQDKYEIKNKMSVCLSVCLFVCMYVCMHAYIWTYVWAPRGLGDLGRRAIYFQGAGEHWQLFLGSWGASSWF